MISNPKILLPRGSLVEDKYEIQFPSGSCGFSDSFRASDAVGNSIRLELIDLASLPGSSFDDGSKLRNVKLLRLFRHPNIPELLDDGETVIGSRQFAYLTFPFISGESLFELLGRQGILSPYKVMPIALELLETLDYLHNLDPPVIHNGISLNSIMLDYSTNRDKPIIIGFDHAREIHAPRSSISLKALSLFHAAPELLHGVFVPQSDLFSVGAVMHHLILGVPPWCDKGVMNATPDKLKLAIADARSKPLNLDLVDESVLDEHFKHTLKKALSLDVEGRFQSAEEFARALKVETPVESSSIEISAGSSVERKEKKPGTGFDGIAGMEELKSVLHNEVIRPIVERERFEKFGIPLLNGILLYGPPRCGKTFIGERLVEEVGFNFRKVSPSELGSKWVNEGSEKIARLFRDAAEVAPCLIFIDEFDALAPSREGDLQHHYAAEVNELLAQMNNCGERGIFVIGATNRPEKIDAAVLGAGRFDKHVFVPQPDFAAREAMFRLHLDKHATDLALDHARLAELTKNYVSADIAKLVVEAARKSELLHKAGDKNWRISMKMLEDVIAENKPSVTLKQLKAYEEMHQRWVDERSGIDPDNRRSIGFVLHAED